MQLKAVAPCNPRLDGPPYVIVFHIICRLQNVREAVEQIYREKSRISIKEILAILTKFFFLIQDRASTDDRIEEFIISS